MQRWLPVVFCVLLFGGCSTHPVRHLTSDVSLLVPGTSTRQEVLQYLGEPDTVRNPAAGIEELVYHDSQKKGILRNTPLLRTYFSSNVARTIVVTLNGGVVSNCKFKMKEDDDRDWAKDCNWKEVR